MNINILQFDSICSTNTEAINQAKRGAEEGLCVVANEQTAGRGRHGRNWVSEKNSGLYFSIILRPQKATKFLPLITLMTSIAVYETLKETYDLQPDIKWSNDVLVYEKKICGILAETAETPKGLAIIVGIGINLTSKNFPAEISDTATSIEQTSGKKANAEELTESLIKFLIYFYSIFSGEEGEKEIINEWSKRSSYFSGKNVKVDLGNEIFTGVTCGLADNGALKVKKETGEIIEIQAGDVEKLRSS